MTAKRPDLSVIVVTHNRTDLALVTLRSALAAADGLDVEWIVVDSGSTDGTADVIDCELPAVNVLRCDNVGFAAANNRALALARGRYLLLLNPDVEIISGTFADLLAMLDARPSVGIASVIQQSADGQLQHSIRRYPSPRLAFGEALALPWRGWREEEQTLSRYREECSVDWVVGAFLLARADVVEQVGGLDERFFLYSEEIDWCYRARIAGWDVRHLPQMVVTHHTAATSRPDLMAQLSYAKVLFACKHHRRLRAVAIRSALAARHLVRVLALSATATRRPEARGRLTAESHALAVVAGIARPPFP